MSEMLVANKRFEQFKRYYRSLEPILEKPRNRVYTAVIFSFLAISLFAWYAIRPTIQTIIYLRREISDKSVLDKQMEQKIANLIEAQANYENIKDQLQLLDEAIPLNPDTLDAISQLQNLISTSGATISAIRVASVPLVAAGDENAKTKTTQPSHSYSINLTVDGRYSDLEQYLQEIINMRRILTVDQLSILPDKDTTSQSSSESGSLLRLTIQLDSYYK
jgi:Tfp pilus assembly protein PilO